MKPLKLIRTKFLNRRVEVCIYDKDGEYSVRVYTKRLIDFKKREISSSDTLYSLETFIAIASINQMIMQDDFFNELFYKSHDDKIYINTETITFKEWTKTPSIKRVFADKYISFIRVENQWGRLLIFRYSDNAISTQKITA